MHCGGENIMVGYGWIRVNDGGYEPERRNTL